MDYELELPHSLGGKKIKFNDHPNFMDSIAAIIPFNNGYGASIITKKSINDTMEKKENGFNMFHHSSQGNWDNQTFELGVVQFRNDNFYFIEIDEFCREDQNYEVNGIWAYLSKKELFEKIKLIKNLPIK